MKKRIGLLFVLFLSLFVFSDKVEAFSMYLQCDYVDECDENSKVWDDDPMYSRWCHPNINYFVPLTKKDGNLVLYAFARNGKSITYSKLDDDYNDYGCWLTDFTNDNCNSSNTYSYGSYNIFSDSVCPSGIVNNKGFFPGNIFTGKLLWSYDVIPVGKNGKIVENSDIDETKYVIYSFINEDGEEQKIAEGYTYDGKYCFAGSNIKTNFIEWFFDDANGDEMSKYLLNQVANLGSNFWKVHTNFESRIIASPTDEVSLDGMNVCSGLSEKECEDSAYRYEVIIDSEDSNGNIRNAVKNWYNERSDELDKLSGFASVVNNDKFIETCENFNQNMSEGKKYTFSDNYTKDEFINDLKAAYDAVYAAYYMEGVVIDYSTGKDTSVSSSIVSYIYKNMLDIDEIVEIAEKDDKEYHININHIVTAIKRDVSEELTNYLKNNDSALDIVNLTENLGEYTEMFYTAVLYLEDNSLVFALNSSQISDIKVLKDNFEDLINEKELNIYPVISCETILSEELIKKINDYLDIIKIVIPILLIGFGIFDFTKAIFAGDDDKMKKAKNTFMQRLLIAFLIFLTPTIVNLILTLANYVWSFISPNSCGLFG